LETNRNPTIDIFRGLTMMLMTLVNNPGSWDHIYAPFEHAEWHGCTPTDLVFPFFALIMCVSIPFSGDASLGFVKILTRTLRIFCLGFFLSFFSKINFGSLDGLGLMLIRICVSFAVAYGMLGKFFEKTKLYVAIGFLLLMLVLAYSGIADFAEVRIPGVLQRLAIIYFAVAMLKTRFNANQLLGLAAVLLLGYWALMALVPVPEIGAGLYEKGKNLAAYIDNLLLPGHLWASSKTWDPEGILSTIPAIGTGLIGLWMGYQIKQNSKNLENIFSLGGLALIVIAKVWAIWFPLNKALWTSSFVLFTAGWAMLIFVVLRLLFQNTKLKPIQEFAIMWGVNPMLVFFASGIIPRALNMHKWGPEQEGTIAYLYAHGIEPLFSEPKIASLAGAIIYIVIWSIILLILKKKNLIFKV
jgi:predicted acyltransferase